MNYNHQKIEKKWQKEWEKNKPYHVLDIKKDAENFYALIEFPYPSGNLHAGHWYAFSVTDIFVRAKRMQGKNVLFPIGFDAFGLPAENAAIQRKLNPYKWTISNISYMRKQLRSMGASFDWSREVVTCDPAYYRWTQWIFLQFFKRGLAYQAETPVNWCPKDKTVLANEQVAAGTCERCGTVIEQRTMKQWMLKITDYAEKLLNGLDTLAWPEEIKEAQRNWIGKSEGAEIDFRIALEKKPNFLILHGYTGKATKNFIPWLTKELKKHNFSVQAPGLPNTNNPKEEEQVNYVLKNCHIDENTIMVGHSLGAIVAMKVLLKLKKSVQGLVLVAAAMDPCSQKKSRPFHKTFSWDIDFGSLTHLAGFRTILSDLTETKRINYLQDLAKKLNAQLVTGIADKEHFTAKKEQLILDTLLPSIKIFTTRSDTLFGATYMVLAPEHELVQKLKSKITNWRDVEDYIKKTKSKTELERQQEKEKTGVELKGIKVINPATKEEIPIFIADYVLAHYGTGAIMAVPAHDERDFEFAKKFSLPILEVIKSPRGEAYIGDGILINSGKFNGMKSEDAKQAITKFVRGKATVQYKLRDWVLSRQRYWGTPIPVIHCSVCGIIAVQEKDLPVKLPEIKDYLPTGGGQSPLAKVKKWISVKCPRCRSDAERETDTMDTFVDSSWYFLRYCDPKNKKRFADLKKMKRWMPVDRYSGGAEHTTMHLLYSRFWIKAMHDLGFVEWDEPYAMRMNRGIILGPDGQKMSKSKGNVVDPDEYVKKLGADTVRMYLAFIGPYNETGSYPWNPRGILGIRRFLDRVWNFARRYKKPRLHQNNSEHSDASPNDTVGQVFVNLDRILHKTIKKVTEDIEQFHFNTAISQLMILFNEMDRLEAGQLLAGKTKERFLIFLKLLAPFAPHTVEELWHLLGNKTSIHQEKWPAFDKKALIEDVFEIIVQINGKMKDKFEAPLSISQEEATRLTLQREKVKTVLRNLQPKKVIFVPNRLINLVV